jgi:A/G-specific adenine glycosylase
VPILDGNVQRVLCRLDQVKTDPRDRATQARLWDRAEQILPQRGGRVGDFNSALMELGATVCTPRNPQCLICPVNAHCEARATGVQDRIPAPRKARPTPLVQRHVYCIKQDSHWLIEQRPATGRWAGMWQFITLEPNPDAPDGARLPVKVGKALPLGAITHALTHRRYTFHVFRCHAASGNLRNEGSASSKWVKLDDLKRYPLPRPHLKIAELLARPSAR